MAMLSYDSLVEDIKKEFPRFRVVPKEDSKLMKLLYLAMLMPLWNREFMEYYVTTFLGTVYMPDRLIGTTVGALVLRHELVHLRDAKRFPVLFELSYLFFPLPMFVTMRAYWEYRAFCETLKALGEYKGCVTQETLNSYISAFCCSNYLWMFPARKYLRAKFMGYLKENNIAVC